MTATRPLALLVVAATLGLLAPARGDDGAAVDRALGYLAREVPAWSREHACFSCHNNGDAARALYRAVGLGRDVPRSATADTDAWLADPARWDKNGGDGPFSDKALARVAFAAGLEAGVASGRVGASRAARVAAGRRLAADQAEDGSWRVGAADPVGSPATYGRPLATWLAADALRAADPDEFAPAVARARRWLAQVEPAVAPAAAAVLLAAASGGEGGPPPDHVTAALAWFAQAQARDGGWGPFATAPPEAFDTALGVLALSRFLDRPGVADCVRRARAFLVDSQHDDGSWTETTRPTGNESYAQRLSTTGWAALALLAPGSIPTAAREMPPGKPDDDPPIANPAGTPPEPEARMADPRNIAHDKKVHDEKKHHGEAVAPENAAVAPQPGKKTPTVHETPHEDPAATHATSQHHKDKTTGHVQEPAEVQAELNAKENATDK